MDEFIIRKRRWYDNAVREDEFLHCKAGDFVEDPRQAQVFPTYDAAKERAEALAHEYPNSNVEAVWLGSYGHLQVERATRDKQAQWQNNIQVFCEVLNHHELVKLDAIEVLPNTPARLLLTVDCRCGNKHSFIVTPGLPELVREA